MIDGKPAWAGVSVDDSQWKQMELPGIWENSGLTGLNGVVWFRKSFYLNKTEANSNLGLSLAKIDDSDQVWVNGHLVGGLTQAYNVTREYEVDASQLVAGENVIVVRVVDTGGGGGIYGDPELLFYQSSIKKESLAGQWLYKVGEVSLETAVRVNQTPTLLYNHMIHPIKDFPIKGVIWYQGESNSGKEDAIKYRELFPKMIKDWRALWGIGDFPFLFVQLANFRQAKDQPDDSNWALLREAQSQTLAVPKTAQAVIIDIGEANDIHPRNKQDVGYRLALGARNLAYGESELEYSGPSFEEMKVEGKAIRLKFSHTGGGLMAKDKYGYLKAFSIAGADKKFLWAQARIVGDEVVVWSDQISKPVAVRYGWADNPDDANLYNKEGLPASPFRTDNW